MKKVNLKKEVENLQNFSDIDVTQYPSPEQLSLAREIEITDNIVHYDYYIDGKTVIVELDSGEYVAFKRNPKSKSSFGLYGNIMCGDDSVLINQVFKISVKKTQQK